MSSRDKKTWVVVNLGASNIEGVFDVRGNTEVDAFAEMIAGNGGVAHRHPEGHCEDLDLGDKTTAKSVRVWSRQKRIEVPDHGRISQKIMNLCHQPEEVSPSSNLRELR